MDKEDDGCSQLGLGLCVLAWLALSGCIHSTVQLCIGKSWGREVTAQREVKCNAFHYYPVMK